MKTEIVTVVNPTGLHARPAAKFVKKAMTFSSTIRVENTNNGASADAKSIIMLLTLALSQGTAMKITADGPDETEAVQTLAELVEGGFGEV